MDKDDVLFTYVNVTSLISQPCSSALCSRCKWKATSGSTKCIKGEIRTLLHVTVNNGTVMQEADDVDFIMKAVTENILEVCTFGKGQFCVSECGFRCTPDSKGKNFCRRASIRTILNKRRTL